MSSTHAAPQLRRADRAGSAVIARRLRGRSGAACSASVVAGRRARALLADLNYRIDLDPRTTLNLQVGVQKVKHFREADTTDDPGGATHKRWGFDFSAARPGVNTRVREVYLVPDGKRLRVVGNSRLVVGVARKFWSAAPG